MSRQRSRRPSKGAATNQASQAPAPRVPPISHGTVFDSSSLQCPDCSAQPIGIRLIHSDTCPLDRAVNLVIDGDRDWFEAHPDENIRRRPVTPAEVADLVASGIARPVGTVTVFQLTPGLRSRMFEYEGGAI